MFRNKYILNKLNFVEKKHTYLKMNCDPGMCSQGYWALYWYNCIWPSMRRCVNIVTLCSMHFIHHHGRWNGFVYEFFFGYNICDAYCLQLHIEENLWYLDMIPVIIGTPHNCLQLNHNFFKFTFLLQLIYSLQI